MIPNGLNPHGLEDRKIQFHRVIVQVNGSRKELTDSGLLQTDFKNRLYCYLTIPSAI